MNITIDITEPTELTLNQFKDIYEASFPVDERRPWENLKK